MTPCVSILLPTYNGEKFLSRCVQSVLNQTVSDFELLVGDDGSVDSTPAIAAQFRDPRIRYFRRTHNVGLFKNLNSLLPLSRAPIIRFLCQDDALVAECVEEELRFLEARSEIGMSFCKTVSVDEQDQILKMC